MAVPGSRAREGVA